MLLRCLYVLAEGQLVHTLRRAAALLESTGTGLFVALEGYTVEELAHVDKGVLERQLAAADVFIGSMLNSDQEVALLTGLLAERRPPVTVVFTSQPELTMLSRLGAFDAQDWVREPNRLHALAQRLNASGIQIPPSPFGLLSMLPRLAYRLGPETLGDAWAYGQAGAYWLNASPENWRRLLMHLANYHPAYGGRFRPDPPIVFPEIALWHPRADQYFSTYTEYQEWYRQHRGQALGERPAVGVIVFRQYVTGGAWRHYDAVIAALEAEGLDVVAGFGGLDNRRLIDAHFRPAGIELLLNLTGFNLIGSMGRPQPEQAVALLKELDIPYLVPFPLLFQTRDQWEADPVGLAPMQTALQVVLPELEGATEPRVFAAKGDDGDFVPNLERVQVLARRVRRWVDLRRKTPAERRVAITIFSFPPDKGSVGSAAYLDVFRSLYNLLAAMARDGYRVALPPDAESLMRLVLGADEALPGAPTIAIADTLPVDEYRRLVPGWGRIAANFGAPPGFIDADWQGLRIRGAALGNVFVGVQPGFGYEGDPMRLLFARDATPSHSFAAYYAWLRHCWNADVVLHFGTHGALEFMPGKQLGLTSGCWPDVLLGDVAHVYFYSMNNPSEATIAKRRSYATTVTYLSPPLREAGLYKTLASLEDALAAWRQALGGAQREQAWETVRALAQEAQLDADVKPPESGEAAEDYIDRLSAYLRTLAERLIPVGLHVAGAPLSATEAAEFLWAALQHPRPEQGVPALPQLIAREMGLDWDALAPADARREAIIAAGRGLLHDLVAGRFPQTGDPRGDRPEWQALSRFAADFLERLKEDTEIPALLRAIAGRYIPPAPGGDPARVPAALPTGRNVHALDPNRIPSPVAVTRAQAVVQQLLERTKAREGRWPETIACVLWGTDNIKTHGEGVAQVLELIGVRARPDSLGRMTRLELVPLAELGRPRIDVVLSVSGIFRDIFPTVMELLDRAVRLAATAEEDPELNYIRKHTLAIAAELGIPHHEAARRVFSNAPGQYGTGVNHVVEASTWQSSEELGAVFLERKAYVYGDGAAGQAHPGLLAACLRTCGTVFQNLDSTEIGLADVDHYYEYLGGLSAAARRVRGTAPEALVADTVTPDAAVRTLEETIRLETRTRLLNPRWYEAMLRHGYQGVHELATRLDNTFGWSATAGAVESWVYTAAADTFLLDDEMRARLLRHNPRAVHRMAARLAEARARGF
ncbi:MAG: magnesium chelatase subunit H [Firmicutes bacterium ZCTH02-B6]|nr:MAG: magnesium chelatase subunit H [Firmicutes bacterium ZCTH02-B6]